MAIQTRVRSFVPIFLSILLFTGCSNNQTSPSPKITQSLVTGLETPVTTITSTVNSGSNTVAVPTFTETSTVKKTNSPTQTTPLWQLTFVSDRSGLNGIYAIDVSCIDAPEVCLGEPNLLFDWKEELLYGMDWSPDGKKVVFPSNISGTLFLADWNGNNAVDITDHCDGSAFPKWSMDGKQIAFIFFAGKPGCEYLNSPKIQLFEVENSQMKPILSEVIDPSRINWLPGGGLAYISTLSKTDYGEIISIVDQEGKLLRQIPENPKDYTHLLGLDFSPDGNRLVFVGNKSQENGNNTTDIYMTDLNTNNTINLTNGMGTNLDPVWSPSGDWIAFMSNRTGDWEIYLIRPDGSGLVNVTQNPASDTDPAWRRISNP